MIASEIALIGNGFVLKRDNDSKRDPKITMNTVKIIFGEKTSNKNTDSRRLVSTESRPKYT